MLDKIKNSELKQYYDLALGVGELIDIGIATGDIEELIKPFFNAVEELYRISINTNISNLSAELYRAKYEAYLKVGFDEFQAFKLLISDRQDFSKIISKIQTTKSKD